MSKPLLVKPRIRWHNGRWIVRSGSNSIQTLQALGWAAGRNVTRDLLTLQRAMPKLLERSPQ